MKQINICLLILALRGSVYSCSIAEIDYENYVEFLSGNRVERKISKIDVEIADYKRPLSGGDSCSGIGYLTIAVRGVDARNLYSFSLKSEEREFRSFEKEKGAYRGSVDDGTGAAIFHLRMSAEDVADFRIELEVMEFDPYGSLVGKGDAAISSRTMRR